MKKLLINLNIICVTQMANFIYQRCKAWFIKIFEILPLLGHSSSWPVNIPHFRIVLKTLFSNSINFVWKSLSKGWKTLPVQTFFFSLGNYDFENHRQESGSNELFVTFCKKQFYLKNPCFIIFIRSGNMTGWYQILDICWKINFLYESIKLIFIGNDSTRNPFFGWEKHLAAKLISLQCLLITFFYFEISHILK